MRIWYRRYYQKLWIAATALSGEIRSNLEDDSRYHLPQHRAAVELSPMILCRLDEFGEIRWSCCAIADVQRRAGRTVRLLDQKMRPVAVHVQRQPGAFSTHDAHILPEKISGIERGTTWLLRRVESIGPHAAHWAQSMLQNRGIEGVRVLMGLLSLTSKYRRDQIEPACQAAHSHGAYRLRSLRQLIDHQSGGEACRHPANVQQNFEFTQEHPIIRNLGDYGQFVRQAITQTPLLESTP